VLILTRRVGESITIGQDIKIKVISVEQGQVRLGFDAPMDVPIFRDELIATVKNQNLEASNSFLEIDGFELDIIKK